MTNNRNQDVKFDNGNLIRYILSQVSERLSANTQDFYLVDQALKEKKNVRIEIETTFGNLNNVVFWIKEKRGLFRKLSL